MERVMVVVDSDSEEKLLREAGTLAAGVGAELVVFSLLSREEFEADLDVLGTIESVEQSDTGDPSGEELAIDVGRELAREALDDVAVEFEVVGAMVDGGRAGTIVERATEHDCDHVFVHGSRRSPAGKAVFGDVAQGVLLNFDGYVTVHIE